MEAEQLKQPKQPLFKLIAAEKPKHCIPDCSVGSTQCGSKGQKTELPSANSSCNSTYKCHIETCSRSFSYLYQLRKHLSFVHKIHFYDCSRCGSRFNKYSSYMKHMKNLLSCETAIKDKSLSHKAHQTEDALSVGLLTAKQLIEQFSLDKITVFDEKMLHQRCPGLESFALTLIIN